MSVAKKTIVLPQQAKSSRKRLKRKGSMKIKKVSIISPCYNGESYLVRFFDSLMAQDYPVVEFIFVNDGSTDGTEKIFEEYRPKLEAKGWNVIYLKQENAGQAAAISAGLKIFTGDYLLWPDSDDILYPHHIAEKVALMEESPAAGIGFCRLEMIDENTPDKPVCVLERRKVGMKDDFAGDLLISRNILWPPVGAVIRASAFLDVNPAREIYAGTVGQNFQMFFPVAVKYPVVYTDKILGAYLIRQNSHSRLQNDYAKRQIDHADTWVHTIMRAPLTNEEKTRAVIRAVNHFECLKDAYSGKFFPAVSAAENRKTRKIKLFGFIPILKICRKKNKTVVKLFDFIPFLKVK